MVIILVTITPKPGMNNALESELDQIAQAARQLPGCLTYQWFYAAHSHTEPIGYLAYGEFSTLVDFETYLRSDIVKQIGQRVIPLLAGKPRYKHYQAILLQEG